jgi:hypothetical protein
MKVRSKKVKNKKVNKEYLMYFVVFSIEYSDILKNVKELRNIEIVTGEKRYFIKKATVYKHSDYKRKKTGERIPLYAIVIPKKEIANELISKGIRKVKVIAEVPEVDTSKTENQTTNVGETATANTTPNNVVNPAVDTNTNTAVAQTAS